MLIHRLTVAGLLSFGPEGIDLPLQPLNVLIGPNGSGKSNLLEVLALLRASPDDLPAPIKALGGVEEWLWKAPTVAGLTNAVSAATIDAVVESPRQGEMPVRHVLEIIRHGDRFEVADERIENERPQTRLSRHILLLSLSEGRAGHHRSGTSGGFDARA